MEHNCYTYIDSFKCPNHETCIVKKTKLATMLGVSIPGQKICVNRDHKMTMVCLMCVTKSKSICCKDKPE